MSRVLDALQRALEEKKETWGKSSGGQWVLGEKSSLGEALKPPRDDLRSSTIQVPHFRPWPKSWRERLEELFFGWDLRRFKTYPIVSLENESPAAEQYKILREQIRKLRSETGVCSLSVTSPLREDGKTTVAVNLAAAIAWVSEEQVLLIDGDMRSPEIHRFFGIQPSPGLAEYLSSSSNGSLMSYVKETFLPNLRILPAGEPTEQSSELLAKKKMKNLMEEIRASFPGRQIIVDTSPVLSTPDPFVLAGQVDGILMVIRAGKTPRGYLLKAIQSLNSNKLIGIVLNGAELGAASKYYYPSSKKA